MSDAERLAAIRRRVGNDDYRPRETDAIVRFLLDIIDQQATKLRAEKTVSEARRGFLNDAEASEAKLRLWVEDEQRKREHCEDQRTDERS